MPACGAIGVPCEGRQVGPGWSVRVDRSFEAALDRSFLFDDRAHRLALALPFVPFAAVLGFVPLPATLVAVICGITVLDVAATEWTKRRLSVTGP